jgi:hypothetical protein
LEKIGERVTPGRVRNASAIDGKYIRIIFAYNPFEDVLLQLAVLLENRCCIAKEDSLEWNSVIVVRIILSHLVGPSSGSGCCGLNPYPSSADSKKELWAVQTHPDRPATVRHECYSEIHFPITFKKVLLCIVSKVLIRKWGINPPKPLQVPTVVLPVVHTTEI